jgi:hypothetical protein
MASSSGATMGFVPGGQIDQKVLVDPHGIDTWDVDNFGTLIVHVLNSAQYEAVTGRPAPPSPVSARTYAEHGFPWFRHYEEGDDVRPAEALAALTSIAELNAPEAGESVEVDPSAVIELSKPNASRRSSERS